MTKRFTAQGERFSGTLSFLSMDHFDSIREISDDSATFDSLGMVTGMTNPLGAFTYAYPGVSGRMSMTTSIGSTTFACPGATGARRLSEIKNMFANSGGTFAPNGSWGGRPSAAAPKGTYAIVDEPSGTHTKSSEGPWYGLFKDDSNLDDATWDGLSRRTGLRLHFGSISTGCATVNRYQPHALSKWTSLSTLISSTKPKGHVEFNGKKLVNYGTLVIQ